MSLNILASATLDLSLKQLWGLINTAQLLSYLLMICVPKPYNIVLLLSELIFANGDLVILQALGDFLNLPIVSSLEEEFSEEPFVCFEQADFESSSFLLNQEISIYLAAVYILGLTPLAFACASLFRICRCKCAQATRARFLSIYSCQAFQRLILELYLDLSISSFIGLSLFKKDSLVQVVDLVSRLSCLVLLVLTPLIYSFVRLALISKQLAKVTEEPALSNLNEKKVQSILLTLFLSNRLSFAALTVFLKDYLLF